MASTNEKLALLAGGAALGAVAASLPALLRRLRAPSGGTHAVRAGASIRVPRYELEELVSACLCAAGATEAHARAVAKVLIFADARGIPSHGVNRCDFYASELEHGLVDGAAEPAVAVDSGCCAVVDGRNALGAVVGRRAIELAIAKAREHGVGWVVCRGSNHFGAAGYWAEQASQQGLMGFSFTNTAPFMVPTGGRTRAVGTNPICCFAPAAGGETFELDMATTAVPIGKVEVMARLGRPLPAGWGVDRDGKPCSDAREVGGPGGLFPLGGEEETAGYKGYGLGMLVEVLTAVLSGAAVGPAVQPWVTPREGPMDFGHCFIVLDPARLGGGGGGGGEFGARLSAYMAAMRALPGTVQVPGDPEKAHQREAARLGIALHPKVAAALKALALKWKVATPRSLDAVDASQAPAHLYRGAKSKK